MSANLRAAVALAKLLKEDAPKSFVAPPVGTRPANEYMLPFALVRGTRGYIERVVNQINGCYERGWFDGCAVMMRRLIETLIIECFEHHKIDSKIKDAKGDYYFLEELINRTLAETKWSLGRNTKQGLPNLKRVGDYSAHTRRYNAHRGDIDKVASDFRVVCEELLYVAELRK
jgi:hypothetical protein